MVERNGSSITVEICCGGLEDCLAAQRCGADRIELVSAHVISGLTPSIGTVIAVKEQVDIPVMSIARTRMSGFCYSDEDFQVLCLDARKLVEYGSDGVVFGFLKPDCTLDYERCARFIEAAGDAQTVFHRAIDLVPDPLETARQLIRLGVTRILTSGGEADAYAGAATISLLQKEVGDRIEILAGGGVRASNVGRIIDETGVRQVHFGGTGLRSDPSARHNGRVSFGVSQKPAADRYIAVDPDTVAEIMKHISGTATAGSS